jgi:hypothetical protein
MYERQLPPLVKSSKDTTAVPIRTRAYVLVDRLLVFRLKKALMDTRFNLFRVSKTYASFASVIYLYKHLPDGEPMLQLVADAFLHQRWHRETEHRSRAGISVASAVSDSCATETNELNKMAEGDKKLKREVCVIKKENGPRNGGDGSST